MTGGTTSAVSLARPPARRAAELGRRASYAVFATALLVVLVVANVAVNPVAFGAGQITTTVGLAAPLVLAAMAVAPSVLVGGGGIDLSVGPLMGLVDAVLIVGLIGRLHVSSPPAVVLAAIALGLVSGVLTGLLVAVLRLQPIVATLGTYLAYSGLTLIIAPQPTGTVPSWLSAMATNGSIPTLAGVIAAWWLFTRTPLFDALMATGGDDRAAYVAGVAVNAIRVLAYAICGIIAAIAGLSLAAILGSVDPNAGVQYTLLGIASVALGGVSLAGGRGGMLGAVVGALDVFLVQNILTFYNISSFVEQVVYGAILVLAVCLNRTTELRLGRAR
jgi:ribose transport system permease protein